MVIGESVMCDPDTTRDRRPSRSVRRRHRTERATLFPLATVQTPIEQATKHPAFQTRRSNAREPPPNVRSSGFQIFRFDMFLIFQISKMSGFPRFSEFSRDQVFQCFQIFEVFQVFPICQILRIVGVKPALPRLSGRSLQSATALAHSF